MKKFKYRIRTFFGFSKKETNGFLVLVLAMLLMILVPVLTGWLYEGEKNSYPDDQKKLDSLVSLLSKKSNHPFATHEKKSSSSVLFNFDPNSVDASQLNQLFGKKIAGIIVNYRNKGGKFRVKGDLRKIYGIDSATFNKVERYILLPSASDRGKKQNVSLHQTVLLDINKTDSLQLQSLKGIGKVLSARIIKYRNKLGGFVSEAQYKEIYGLDTSVVSLLQAKTYIADQFIPQKINLNTTSFSGLMAHPYIGKKYSGVIENYRRQHVFKSLAELSEIPSVSKSDYEKMLPYLDL